MTAAIVPGEQDFVAQPPGGDSPKIADVAAGEEATASGLPPSREWRATHQRDDTYFSRRMFLIGIPSSFNWVKVASIMSGLPQR